MKAAKRSECPRCKGSGEYQFKEPNGFVSYLNCDYCRGSGLERPEHAVVVLDPFYGSREIPFELVGYR